MDSGIAREESLFEAAVLIEDVAERDKFLDASCAGDAGLRNQLEKLLAAHAKSERIFTPRVFQFIRQGVSAGVNTGDEQVLDEKLIGERVGRYKILQKLGEGGCGAVYLAEQLEPLRRRVALKVVKLGMDTRSVITRFETERQALALMDHPNIAKVLDAGATESGRPFFVMEFVQGTKITDYCDEHRLDTPQRLRLFVQVCHAIQHAHQKGVIHRDIKPSNILITVNNDVPMPKVIDFGIAKATEGKLTENTVLTAYGQFIGTPAYMSPEQVELRGMDVDTRSDIYSLGALLYELLTGRTPFDQKDLVNSGFGEMRRTLLETEPSRPSSLLTSLAPMDLTTIARCRHTEPPNLIKSVKGDLDWIAMKALEKDRARRYQTANGLAMDVQRYLVNEPVLARPPSQLYRLRKLVRRNKVVFASGTVVLATLVAGLGVSTYLFLSERELFKVQERLRHEAEQARNNESHLRKKAEVRETINQATVLAARGKMNEADNLLAQVPQELLSPSMDAAAVFRDLGNWNVINGNWLQAADRYMVLLSVGQIDKDDQTDATTRDLLMAAPLLIEAGHLTAYDGLRKMEIDRLTGTKNLVAVEQLLKTSLLLPADTSLMRRLDPLGKMLADSLARSDPTINDGAYYYAPWRTLALALMEYRRGDFPAAVALLEKCLGYPSQTPSCVASAHVLLGMCWFKLGKLNEANAESKLGSHTINRVFRAKFQWSDMRSGLLPGWLMARILLREAEGLQEFSPRH